MNAGGSECATRWIEVADAAALKQAAYEHIVGAATRAIGARGAFLICLAGGNTPRDVYGMLRSADTDWSRWQVYFGDERCAPMGDPERNSTMASETWLDHAAIPRDRIHVIPAELGAVGGAHDYSETLRGIGDFDLALLGLGEDGHTASLFPGHDWGVAANSPDALAVFDAPKPPPQRVSLSASRLSRAREVLFLVEGESKRDAVIQWRSGVNIPARAICPASGVDVYASTNLIELPPPSLA